MRIINIGGVINAGKSTVSKLLAERLPNSVFIEVDDLILDAEEAGFPDHGSRIRERLSRLYSMIDKHLDDGRLENIIFAYPMYDETYDRVAAIADGKAEFVVVTLAPQVDALLTNRGARELDDKERARISEMLDEGAYRYRKSDKIIDNTHQTPVETAEKIIEYLSRKQRHKVKNAETPYASKLPA